MRDGIHLEHVAVGALAIVLRELTERTFRFAGVRQQVAFNDDLGLRGDVNRAGFAGGCLV
jgi:hypothetical protein